MDMLTTVISDNAHKSLEFQSFITSHGAFQLITVKTNLEMYSD